MNNDKLSYDGVFERISKGVYDIKCSRPKRLLKDTEIIDEDKSVKWNREQIALENEKIRLHNEAIKEAKKEGPRKLENDLKEALMNEHGLNANQADKVYRKAYENGYSAATVASNDVPFKEMLKESNFWILWKAQELGELTEAVLKLS